MYKPVYGNFQRYYHIRNPVNCTVADERHPVNRDHNSTHPALALDSRLTAILGYLSAHHTPPRPFSAVEAGQITSVLDIGCNSGKLTIQFAQTLPLLLCERTPSALHPNVDAYWPSVYITGVDIDPSLIQQAREAAAVARSLYRPKQLDPSPGKHTTFRAQARVRQIQLPSEAVFFPSAFPSLLGSRPGRDHREAEPCTSKRRKTETERNNSSPSPLPDHIKREVDRDRCVHLSPTRLRFLAADWVHPESSTTLPFRYRPSDLSELAHSDLVGYTLILALSLTKWVHIQQTDSGLVRFFARIACTLVPNGLLFLEPQEWRSYHSAKNMDPTIKRKIKTLQIRPGGDFDWILESLGLRRVEQEIGRGVGVGFARPLQVFRKLSKGEEGEVEGAALRKQLMNGDRLAWVSRWPVGVR